MRSLRRDAGKHIIGRRTREGTGVNRRALLHGGRELARKGWTGVMCIAHELIDIELAGGDRHSEQGHDQRATAHQLLLVDYHD
jgi:hypothetical protein